ncbi:DNA methyltransferase Dim-2 [Curvularia kusanoi]|uniref:DNA (cytosine-5-)-methyltransferase n=1 Tax=Curvularia kusanoi TaxID=90978 RepID=A0A9P4T916_CURKU|nr:DNA methyltransferase Dim-2 [Curvularia kusanoi]
MIPIANMAFAKVVNREGRGCANLCNYEVYRSPRADFKRDYAYDLICLHQFGANRVDLRFDGVISCGRTSYFVKALPIIKIHIDGGNGTEMGVFIQTKLTVGDVEYDVWLHLQTPASTYERFHAEFLWVALFSRYVIEYLGQSETLIGLHNFRRDFICSLREELDQNDEFRCWFEKVQRKFDLRVALHANIDFVWKQTIGLPNQEYLQSHYIWADCMQGDHRAIVQQTPIVESTITTPLVFDLFEGLDFDSYLQKGFISKSVRERQYARKQLLGFAEDAPTQYRFKSPAVVTDAESVNTGDVISFCHEQKPTRSGDNVLRFGLVQSKEVKSTMAQGRIHDEEYLHVLRLYRPAETIISAAPYPVSNELFLSDDCNCENRLRVRLSDVHGVHSVDWSPITTLETPKDFIVRQVYLTKQKAFVTLQDGHKICPRRRSESPPPIYHQGDTIYVQNDALARWAPVVIRGRNLISGTYKAQILAPLDEYKDLAKQLGRTHIYPNELVLTPEKIDIHPSQIQRRCNVRYIPQSAVMTDEIPFPYNRRGTGDHCFLSMALLKQGQCLEWLTEQPWPLEEIPAVHTLRSKLQGLSIFSGGGGLDRGLEEAGAVEIKHVVDFDSSAIHTHRANSEDPSQICFYCGSVDDYLQGALTGSNDESIACVGEIDFICGGCPCQGFSSLQTDKKSEKSLVNISHATSFCSFTDLFRPSYAILENVQEIGARIKGGKIQLEAENDTTADTESTEDTDSSEGTDLIEDTELTEDISDDKSQHDSVLARLIACLVSMGYQVNHFKMNSMKYGSCQGRLRLILTVAAPGLTPIAEPERTHSKLDACKVNHTSSADFSNKRECSHAPFRQVSAEDGIGDLPDIDTGTVHECIPFPDHRLPNWSSEATRDAAALPPILDHCVPRKQHKRMCKCCPLATVTTTNGRVSGWGAGLHWTQPRPLTIHEARRGQGWPDNEVVVGSPNKQYAIVGNGVDRSVSFALGLSLFQSVARNVEVGAPNLTPSLVRQLPFRMALSQDSFKRADPQLPTPEASMSVAPPKKRLRASEKEVKVQSRLDSRTLKASIRRGRGVGASFKARRSGVGESV